METSSQAEGLQDEPIPENPSSVTEPEASLSTPENKLTLTDFTVEFLGEAPEETINFSLEIPSSWSVKKDGSEYSLSDDDKIVAQVIISRKADTSLPPFADIDVLLATRLFDRALTVARYPAKCYISESGTEGSSEKHFSYYYYVLADNSYAIIWFCSNETSDAIADSYDQILSALVSK